MDEQLIPDINSIDIEQIAEEIKDYAAVQSQVVFQQMTSPGLEEGGFNAKIKPVSAYSKPIVTNRRVLLTRDFINSVIQPGGNGKFEPKEGVFGFKNREADVRDVKIDLNYTQKEIMQWWQSYYGAVTVGTYDPQTFPFAQYFFDRVVKKAQSDLRNAVWNGVYDPTKKEVLDCFDGWLKIMADCIASEELPASNFVTVGNLTVENIIDTLDNVLELIPDEYLYHPDMVCVTNGRIERLHNKGYAKAFGAAPYNTSYEQATVTECNIPLIVEPSLRNYNKPIFTLKSNLAHLFDNQNAQKNLRIGFVPQTRSIFNVADFKFGAGISAPELIWSTN